MDGGERVAASILEAEGEQAELDGARLLGAVLRTSAPVSTHGAFEPAARENAVGRRLGVHLIIALARN
jgi:hypothetical protein